MSLKTLEQRFNETAKEIYNRFQPDRDQLVTIKPDTNGVFGSQSRVKDDTRALPTTSFARDARRIGNFLKSSQGILYLGKQALLQTGNTFTQTRIYNPLSNIRIPNVTRTKRYIGSGTSTALLQTETVLLFSGKDKKPTNPPSDFLKRLPEDISVLFRPELRVFSAGDNVYSPFLIFSTERTQKKSNMFGAAKIKINGVEQDGDVNNRAFSYGKNRKQVLITNTVLTDAQVKPSDRLSDKRKKFVDTFTNGGSLSEYYFNAPGYAGKLDGESYLYESLTTTDTPVNSARPISQVVSYDPLNVYDNGSATFATSSFETKKLDYTKLVPEDNATGVPDIINFAFQANGVNEPIIKFRAFISTFKQTTKPEFQEQKYLGRTERFVTYGGAKRMASLSFKVVAFSQRELSAVWSKINYLTGLAFPLGVSNSGFMVPPLFKISIGGIYDAQPCYIDNLEFDFIDESITFDVDNEVSQYINVNMSIVLLEKRSRFYNSPFYEITQNLVDRT